ncbi:hypothetical protein BDW74DRAFT_187662 [Aspergillus multicolor]|uniref:uncharacterized protein n=1 Tax=Aspergillus multicolor TaxID=41759 RepID=UPI003CCCFB21
MAASLPFELLYQIALILQADNASLTPYTTVCRHWQAAFEALIYSSLTIYSSEEYRREDKELKGISLQQFQILTSDRNIRRREYVRQLRYDILVPVGLLDWTTRKSGPDQYTVDNDVRKGNDKAFNEAVLQLFKTLVPPYRAQFLENGASALEFAACVDKLSFRNIRGWEEDERDMFHRIWAASALQIVAHCPKLTELVLDLDEWVRPDHLEYIQARRSAVAEGITNIPATLRGFNYAKASEAPWTTTSPALDVLGLAGVDTLSASLQTMSTSLRELKLSRISVSLDLLFPLDTAGEPSPLQETLEWPNLKTIELSKMPPRLPSVLEEEHFHRLFISLGYASRKMPRLASASFDLAHPVRVSFTCQINENGRNITLIWDSGSSIPKYRPDERVAKAWGFSLDEVEIHPVIVRRFSVEFARMIA